ncbi:hypothetical protein ACN28S_57265 [Cystobacter fuscus]
MISLKALDNEYIGDMGPGSSWTSVAPKLQAAGFIQAEDARRMMGVYPKYLTRLEGGGVKVTLATMIAASVAYKVPLYEFFLEEEKEP